MTGDIDKALEFWQQSLKGGNQSAVLKKKIQLKKYVAK